MLVKNWMSTPAITIDAHSSLQDAMDLLKAKKISMLPVVDGNRLVGVVADSDIKKASPSAATSLEIHEMLYLLATVEVKDIMSRNPITVPTDFTIEETAEVLMSNNISGVPVMNPDGSIAGVISHTDLFKVIISLTGVKKKGVQFAFRSRDCEGSILEIAHVIRECGGHIVSILTSYENVPEGYRNIYIRVTDTNPAQLEALTAELEKRFTLLYIVEKTDKGRKISILS